MKLRKSKNNSKYKTRLWKLVSEYVRLKDADANGYVRCISCGKLKYWKDIDAGHYIPKSRGNCAYWEPKNINPQCTSCNRFMHGNLNSYALALIEKYGSDILKELEYKSRQTCPMNGLVYLKLIEEYQCKLKNLKKSAVSGVGKKCQK